VADRHKSMCQAWQIVDRVQTTCNSLFLASMSNLVCDPFPLIFKELVLLAVLTTSSLLSKTSNSVRLLCVCVKHLLALLSAIISILSWVFVSYILHSLMNLRSIYYKIALFYFLDYLSYLIAVIFCL
jgi:hypothetical protein